MQVGSELWCISKKQQQQKEEIERILCVAAARDTPCGQCSPVFDCTVDLLTGVEQVDCYVLTAM
jgi:hypothetical protein